MTTSLFPLHKKYRHGRSFFKIISEESFVQLDLIGEAYVLHSFHAKILPDRNYIRDMIENANDAWEEITEDEFDERLHYARKNLREISA